MVLYLFKICVRLQLLQISITYFVENLLIRRSVDGVENGNCVACSEYNDEKREKRANLTCYL